MPVNLNLLPDEVIARGITPPAWGDIPQWYAGGQKLGRESEQANLFRGGLPRDADGNIDWNRAGQMVIESAGAGGVGTGIQLQNFDLGRKLYERLGQDDFGVQPLPPQTAAPQNPPPSIQRAVPAPQSGTTGPQATSFAATDGERLRPGQQGNLGTVTGVTVDGQPTAEPPASFAQRFAAAQVPDVVAQGPEMVAQASEPRTQVAQAQPQLAQSELSERNAQRYETAANKNYQAAAMAAAVGNQALAATFRARGDAYMKQAEQFRGGMIKNQELTTGEKEAGSGGSPNVQEQKRAEKYAEEDAKQFVEQQKTIQAAGNNAATAIQKAQLAKNLTLDPNFTSGPWAKGAEQFQQWRSLFGSNPSSAVPMESFNKLGSDMLQDSIKSMGQSGVGRVLQAEVGIMQRAVASLGITPAANRAILEMNVRVQQKLQEIAQITQHLPPNTATMNATIQNYLKNKPLFTKEEIRNPVLLGAPDAPAGSTNWTPQQWQAWGQRAGIRSGDPIRIQGGRYMAIP